MATIKELKELIAKEKKLIEEKEEKIKLEKELNELRSKNKNGYLKGVGGFLQNIADNQNG